MIPKKGQIRVVKYEPELTEISGIAVPETAAKCSKNLYRICKFGIDTDRSGLRVGDVVALQNLNSVSSVKISFNGRIQLMVDIDDVVAVLEDLWKPVEDMETEFASGKLPKDDVYIALGDSIAILPDERYEAVEVGGVIVGMSSREVQRSHTGVVVSIGEKAQKETGIVPGMIVLYDYYSAISHALKFDVLRFENVLAVFSKQSYQALLDSRAKVKGTRI